MHNHAQQLQHGSRSWYCMDGHGGVPNVAHKNGSHTCARCHIPQPPPVRPPVFELGSCTPTDVSSGAALLGRT